MQNIIQTLTTREQDIIKAVCEAVADRYNAPVIAADHAQEAAWKAYIAYAHPGESRYDEEAMRLNRAVGKAEDALANLTFAQVDEACEAGFKAGQVDGFRLGLRIMAKALQGTSSELLKLIEAAGDDKAAARVIAGLVGAVPVEQRT